jgi:thioredoxin-related protein
MKQFQIATGLILSLAILLSLTSKTPAETESKWVTDFESAKTLAAADEKIIMMSFQGSDWCGACKRLEKSLFQNAEFTAFADSKLVLLKVDFPMKKENKLSKEQTAHNEVLAEKYNQEGKFPKVVFFNGKGEKIGTLVHPKDDAASYIASIKELIK